MGEPSKRRGSLRAFGLNPRALGTNPKALGTNPRAMGTSPKQLRQSGFSTPKRPRKAVVYVVKDTRAGWVKIGATVSLKGRMAAYRSNGDYHRMLAAVLPVQSKQKALEVEGRALLMLGSELPRAVGDWFIGDPVIAVRVLQRIAFALDIGVEVIG